MHVACDAAGLGNEDYSLKMGPACDLSRDDRTAISGGRCARLLRRLSDHPLFISARAAAQQR